jgi:hypothetical protein
LAELRESLSNISGAMPTARSGHAAAPGQSPAPDVNVWLINLSRTTNQLERLSFDPLKPSFLLAVTKR